jgi:hypothetical protein
LLAMGFGVVFVRIGHRKCAPDQLGSRCLDPGAQHGVEYHHLAAVYTFGEHRQGCLNRAAGRGLYSAGLVSRCTLSIIRTVPDLERITMEFVRHPPA